MRNLTTIAVLLVWCLGLAVSDHASATTFTVDTTTDAVDAMPGNGVCATGGGACSLRAAVQEANALAGTEVITVPAGTYVLTIAGSGEDAAATGDLDLIGIAVINGAGAGVTIVDGGGLDRVFDARGSVTITGMTIRGGDVADRGGGIRNVGGVTITDVALTGNDAGTGGGFCNEQEAPHDHPTATLTNVVLSGNHATTGGGLAATTMFDWDLFNPAAVTSTVSVTGGEVAGNDATSGGGIAIVAVGGTNTLNLDGTTVRDNVAASEGGGLYLAGSYFPGTSYAIVHAVATTIRDNQGVDGGGIWGTDVDLQRSSIVANVATGDGGGIHSGVTAIGSGGGGTIVDSTISGNRSNGDGGGMLTTYGTLRGVTITDNLADADGNGSGDGGGLHAPPSTNGMDGVTTTIVNTILAGNQDGGGESPDCVGEVRSLGHNLIGSLAGCLVADDATNTVGIAPALGPLASNGGPTPTHALLAGSPAIDAGAGCSTTDQRGTARPQGPSCDVGAVEQAYVAGSCGNGALDGGEACDDGNVRDGDCCDHLCHLESAGAPCSDGNPCTDDTCDGAGTCTHAASTGACTDGSRCTLGAETCAGGACVPGDPRDCVDPNPQMCLGYGCDPVLACHHVPLTGSSCDDGEPCTDADTCVDGDCVGTPNTDPCDDGNPCTSPDGCGPGGTCVGPPNSAPCDDGNLCTVGDTCSNGQCQPGNDWPCNGDPCERCDPAVGCTTAPRADCRAPLAPRGASLLLTDKLDDGKDAVQWQWSARGGTSSSELTQTEYDLCVYDESAGQPSLVMKARAGGSFPDDACWKSAGGGLTYKDPTGAAFGITNMQLRAATTRVKFKVKGKGMNLLTPTLPLAKDPSVRVELRSTHFIDGPCWTSSFPNATLNTGERFKAKSE